MKISAHLHETLELASNVAAKENVSITSIPHILKAILITENGIPYKFLVSFGVTYESIEAAMGKSNQIHKKDDNNTDIQSPPYSTKVERALMTAEEIAKEMCFSVVGTTHLFLALLEPKGIVNHILHTLGHSAQAMRDVILTYLDNDMQNEKDLGNATNDGLMISRELPKDLEKSSVNHTVKHKTPYLDKFGTDLTEKARKGALDKVIGRTDETNQLVNVLLRRNKNNPMLLGLPGVGKTAIVEGLALRLIGEDVPEKLQDKRLVSLNLNSIVSGTRLRGEFEERMDRILQEIQKEKELILFIDEIHTLKGTGSNEGSLDAANILKPALSRSGFQLIGATTTDEYRKHFETDKALARRFQTISVEEPSIEDTIEMLQGLAPYYSEHHGVSYSDEAIKQAVVLSDRYINERQLPDKAIDLLDDSAIITLNTYNQISPKEVEIKKQMDEAMNNGDLKGASTLYKELQKEKEQKDSEMGSNELLVTQKEIAMVVEKITGIPVTNIIEQEKEKKHLITLAKRLKEMVIGQDEAVETVSKAIKRSRAGLVKRSTPIGSYLFLGPTGVGKTELAKSITQELCGTSDKLIRFDMSEYMDSTSINKLIGSSPGYVGYDQGGLLTEKVRRNPYSVVLLDEIEKAHPDVFNMLLQVLDEGRLSDNQGNLIDFKNTLIIMTSNLGIKEVQQRKNLGFGSTNETTVDKKTVTASVLKNVKESLPPEFINRLDGAIVFNSLTKENLQSITQSLVDTLTNELSEQGYNLTMDTSVIDYIIDSVDTTEYGARPLKRSIQTLIEDEIVDAVLSTSIVQNQYYVVTVVEGQITFTLKK